MIIVQGWASFAGLLIAVLVGAGLQSVVDSRAVAYAFGGAAMAAFGWWINQQDQQRHQIFWLPIQYWGVIIGIGALAGL